MQSKAIAGTLFQLVILGIISGWMTQFFLNETSFNKPWILGTTIWPGITFGIVIAWTGLKLARISYISAFILIITTCASWIISVEVAKQTMNNPLSEAMSFATAGLIGSMGTTIGLLSVSSYARKEWAILLSLTIVAGTIIAALIPVLDKIIGEPLGWIFFPLWQTVVLLTIAKGLIAED